MNSVHVIIYYWSYCSCSLWSWPWVGLVMVVVASWSTPSMISLIPFRISFIFGPFIFQSHLQGFEVIIFEVHVGDFLLSTAGGDEDFVQDPEPCRGRRLFHLHLPLNRIRVVNHISGEVFSGVISRPWASEGFVLPFGGVQLTHFRRRSLPLPTKSFTESIPRKRIKKQPNKV